MSACACQIHRHYPEHETLSTLHAMLPALYRLAALNCQYLRTPTVSIPSEILWHATCLKFWCNTQARLEAVLWCMTAFCTLYNQEPDNEHVVLDEESEVWSTALLERDFFCILARRILLRTRHQMGTCFVPHLHHGICHRP